MKKRNLMMAVLFAGCLAAVSATGMMAFAEETEVVTEEASEAAADEEAETEEYVEELEDGFVEAETEVAVKPEFKALDYVDLGEYKGLVVELDPIEVTDAEVEEQIRMYATWSDLLETVEDGTVQMGDTLNIDYVGKVDGAPFDGGTDKGAELGIGSGSFIPGFEESLVGAKLGETLDISVTFPENYVEDLAGKDAVFTVTVNEIKRVPEEFTPEMVKAMSSDEYSNIDDFRNNLHDQMYTEKENDRNYIVEENLIDQLSEICTVKSVPDELIAYWTTTLENEYKVYANIYQMNFEDFLSMAMGYTLEQFENEARLVGESMAAQEILLKAIAEKEDLLLTDEAFMEMAKASAEEQGYESVEDMLNSYGEDSVRQNMQQQKVLEFLRENAVITEIVPETETEVTAAEVAEVTETETEA